jgi:hypothetical protein
MTVNQNFPRLAARDARAISMAHCGILPRQVFYIPFQLRMAASIYIYQ